MTYRFFQGRSRFGFFATMLGCLAATGCSASEGEEVSSSNDELRSDATAGGLREGTDEAKAIVALANDRSLSSRDYVSRVRLSFRTSQAVVDVRNGADGRSGTPDDDTFEFLSEIDALPGTTAAAFAQMLAYVKANPGKYFAPPPPPPPTAPESCAGAPLDSAKISALFANGASSVTLNAATPRVYTRPINALGSAGAWVEQPSLSARYIYERNSGGSTFETTTFTTAIPVLTVGADARVWAHFVSDTARPAFAPNTSLDNPYFLNSLADSQGFGVTSCSVQAGTIVCGELQTTGRRAERYVGNYRYQTTSDWTRYTGGLGSFELVGNITNTCFRVSASVTTSTSETMLVLLGTL